MQVRQWERRPATFAAGRIPHRFRIARAERHQLGPDLW